MLKQRVMFKIIRLAQFFIIGAFIVVGATTASDAADAPTDETSFLARVITATFSTGYRTDQLDWSFSGNGVNVLSELEFNDITIYEVAVTADVEIKRAVLTWMAAYGVIVDGTVTDSDYAFDNRNGLFSRSRSDCSGDYTLDLSAGLGYRLSLPGDQFHFTPLAGASFHEQHLRITDGHQTVSTVPSGSPTWVPPASQTGPFTGLDSTYETQWQSAWGGLRAQWDIFKRLSLFGSGAYHFAQYYAKANWNLRSDYKHPISFEHEASGYGIELDGGGSFRLSDHWALLLTARYGQWKTNNGTHRIFHASGAVTELPLNEVNWTTRSLLLSLRAMF